MFKKLRLPALLLLGSALTILTPNVGLARDHDRDEHHRFRTYSRYYGPRIYRPRRSFVFSYGPSYGPGFASGYYDAWGFWHPYGSYDAWGDWIPYAPY